MIFHKFSHSILGLFALWTFTGHAFLPSKVASFKPRQEVITPKSFPLGSSASSVEAQQDQADQTSLEAQPMRLLEEAIGFNTTAAASLLSEINRMREDGSERESIEEFLNNLLSSGPDAPLPFWARSKRLARYSRRARMASLRRTLDMTTPPPSESEDEKNKLSALQRRRRAFVSLLRSLSADSTTEEPNAPLIVSLEKKAIEASKDDADNLRNRLPEGLETPDYEILTTSVASKRNMEIRGYKPFSVCSVSMNKPRPVDSTKTDATVQMPEMGGASSFGALAGYLFGKNDKSTAMAMTTPVLTTPGSDAEDKQMSFILPSDYWDDDRLTTAPQPLSGSGVILQQKEPEERAVLMFGGYASKKEVQKRKKELKTALAKDSGWKALEDEVTVAQYNDPFTVPWRRLNEVSVRVARK